MQTVSILTAKGRDWDTLVVEQPREPKTGACYNNAITKDTKAPHYQMECWP